MMIAFLHFRTPPSDHILVFSAGSMPVPGARFFSTCKSLYKKYYYYLCVKDPKTKTLPARIHGLDSGALKRNELWNRIEKHPRRKVSASRLKKDIEKVKNEN